MTPLIECTGLSKRFGNQVALHDVTTKVFGRSIGLVGPNGAGKTTLMKLCLGLLEPTAGAVHVLGQDVSQGVQRIRLGFAAEGTGHLPDLTGLECVAYAAELCGMRRRSALLRAHEMLDLVGLNEARYRVAENYSTGMLQRTKVAMALAHGPEILLLDEPTSGLDPESRAEFLELLAGLARQDGPAIILSTHILHDVERACDSALILQNGQLKFCGPLSELQTRRSDEFTVRPLNELGKLAEALETSGARVRRDHSAGILEVKLPPGLNGEHIWGVARDCAVELIGFEAVSAAFEDAFLERVGEKDGER